MRSRRVGVVSGGSLPRFGLMCPRFVSDEAKLRVAPGVSRPTPDRSLPRSSGLSAVTDALEKAKSWFRQVDLEGSHSELQRNVEAELKRQREATNSRLAAVGRPTVPESASPTPVERATATKGMAALVKRYGLALAIYYFFFNQACVVSVTLLLQSGVVGGDGIFTLLRWLHVEHWVGDLDRFKDSHFRPFGNWGPEVSARLLANYALATAFMSLWTPLQLPFCVGTLPRLLRARDAAVARFCS